jgi:hypothetical protein
MRISAAPDPNDWRNWSLLEWINRLVGGAICFGLFAAVVYGAYRLNAELNPPVIPWSKEELVEHCRYFLDHGGAAGSDSREDYEFERDCREWVNEYELARHHLPVE